MPLALVHVVQTHSSTLWDTTLVILLVLALVEDLVAQTTRPWERCLSVALQCSDPVARRRLKKVLVLTRHSQVLLLLPYQYH